MTCCGRPKFRATAFLAFVSLKLKYILDKTPKETTSNVFQTGGNEGLSYFLKCSLMKYIRSKKIVLAQQMIREGRKAVDVAEELSFNDYSTFYRSYLKVTGMSPASEKENKR